VEVHGSIRDAVCRRCGRREPLDGVLVQLDERVAPICPSCDVVLKPGVVMFGEMLPREAFDRAAELVRAAGVVLAIGSTLAVWPVAGLALKGGALAVVNHGPTKLDERATVRVDGDAGETLAALLHIL
jgi:NAD-dependent deacetylase